MANRYDRDRYNRRYDYDRERYEREDPYRERRTQYSEDRDFWDRASDEVSSWMGDEEAARRRRIDEMKSEDSYSDYGRRGHSGQNRYDRYGREGRHGQRDYGRDYGRTHRSGRSESEYGYPESYTDYDQGYYGGYDREERMFGTGGREYERGYRPDILNPDYPLSYGDRYTTGTTRQQRTPRGLHTGRGPRGYKRSDERILEDVNDRLMQHSEIDASDIEAAVNDGEVTLSGTVDSRWIKRLAEDIVEDVTGVTQVINLLRVNQDFTQSRDWQATQSGQTQDTEQTGRSKSASAKGR